MDKITILGDNDKLPDGTYRGFCPDNPRLKGALKRAGVGYQLSARNAVVMVPTKRTMPRRKIRVAGPCHSDYDAACDCMERDGKDPEVVGRVPFHHDCFCVMEEVDG